jgi:hypothetical protein
VLSSDCQPSQPVAPRYDAAEMQLDPGIVATSRPGSGSLIDSKKGPTVVGVKDRGVGDGGSDSGVLGTKVMRDDALVCSEESHDMLRCIARGRVEALCHLSLSPCWMEQTVTWYGFSVDGNVNVSVPLPLSPAPSVAGGTTPLKEMTG